MSSEYLTPKHRARPSVSTRVNIAWPPAPPSEDSSVLVLSSSPYISKLDPHALPCVLYLDLRLSLPLSETSELKWAFAGLRHTLQCEPNPKFRWDHFIDSRRGLPGNDIVDEGETILSKDPITGDEIEVEIGMGWNPDTGRVEKYEEMWIDYSLSSDQTFVFMILGENPQTTRGFMAVLGQHALALSHEEGSSFQAVRMKASITPSPTVPGSRWSWEVVYSNVSEGSQPGDLADNLEVELCTFLTMQATELYKWKRGDGVQPNPSNGLRIWTIFDCGLVGASWQ